MRDSYRAIIQLEKDNDDMTRAPGVYYEAMDADTMPEITRRVQDRYDHNRKFDKGFIYHMHDGYIDPVAEIMYHFGQIRVRKFRGGFGTDKMHIPAMSLHSRWREASPEDDDSNLDYPGWQWDDSEDGGHWIGGRPENAPW